MTKVKNKLNENSEKTTIRWHPGFYGGMELELRMYRDSLEFHSEYGLSKDPLRIDMLIIRKKTDVKINNQIGEIFRNHNILEFKSPQDRLNIDVFFKSVGYAFIYKGLGKTVDEIPFRELTLSLFRDTYPTKLFKKIRLEGGIIERKYPGIYYVTGIAAIPIQIIVTSMLDRTEHAALKLISNKVQKDDVKQFLNESRRYTTQGDVNNANAVLQVSTSANMDLFGMIRRDEGMCQALMELMKDEVMARENEASEATLKKALKSIMSKTNLSAEEAMDMLDVPEENRHVYLVYLNDKG